MINEIFWFIIFMSIFWLIQKKWDQHQLEKSAKENKTMLNEMYIEKHEVEDINANEYRDLDLNFYDETRKEFERLGFRHICDSINKTVLKAVPNSRTFIRVMLGRDQFTAVGIFNLRFQGFLRIVQLFGVIPRNMKTIDLETEFEDGSFISTTTANFALMNTHPKIYRESLRQATSIEKLIEIHNERIGKHETEFNTRPVLVKDKHEIQKSQDRFTRLQSQYRKNVGGIVTKEEMDKITEGTGLRKIGEEVQKEMEKKKYR